MTIPNLAGVITKADIDTKGTGSYAASYINWAKVAHLLHEHAKGWEFHLKPSAEGGLIWAAPDNTAYVIGYFSGPDDQATADFPFPAMDNRNNPIPLDRVNARTLTDTHRRALCAAAAFTFGLAYELWAKEEVENPHREETPAKPPLQQTKPQPKPAVKTSATPAQPKPAPAKAVESPAQEAVEPPLSKQDRDEIMAVLGNLKTTNKTAFAQFEVEFRSAFNLAADSKISPVIQEKRHGDFIQAFLASLPDA